jgi:hypothetical protein
MEQVDIMLLAERFSKRYEATQVYWMTLITGGTAAWWLASKHRMSWGWKHG